MSLMAAIAAIHHGSGPREISVPQRTVFVDAETGCNYIIWDRGLAPRYGADGKVIGCGDE
jgi:hypothetical protein